MIFPIVVLVLFFLLVIILIVLQATGTIQPQPTDQSEFEARIARSASLQAGFGMPQPVPCSQSEGDLCRGQCLLYETFSTELDVVDGLTPLANLNSTTLPASFTCLDGYTQALQKQMATCNQELCVGRGGDQFQMGQTEFFYTPCGDLQPCSNTLRSALILRFSQSGTTFDRTTGRCVTVNADISPAQFSPQICPAQAELNPTDEAFLNIDQVPIQNSDNTMVQIRAPLTSDCLLFDSNTIVSGPCITTQGTSTQGTSIQGTSRNLVGGPITPEMEGFVWIYLSGPISVPTLIGNPGRIYPPQILANTSALASAQSQLASLFSSLNTRLTRISTGVGNLSGNNLNFVQVQLARSNDPIQNGDRNTLKSLENTYRTLATVSFGVIFKAAREAIEYIVDIYDILGVTGSSGFSGGQVRSLQLGSNMSLELLPIGSCTSSQQDCQFNTVIVPSNAYSCVV